MHTYTVKRYYPSRTGSELIDVYSEVQATTAADAIRKASGYSRFAYTCVEQNHEQLEYRDNAHYQRDSAGTQGWAAWRKGFDPYPEMQKRVALKLAKPL